MSPRNRISQENVPPISSMTGKIIFLEAEGFLLCQILQDFYQIQIENGTISETKIHLMSLLIIFNLDTTLFAVKFSHTKITKNIRQIKLPHPPRVDFGRPSYIRGISLGSLPFPGTCQDPAWEILRVWGHHFKA